MESVPLPDGGILLGRVLSSAGGFPEWTPCSLAMAASSHDPTKKVKWLFANIWGNYVGFLPGQHGHPPVVLRDPGGGLPCYRARWRGFDVFTSNVDILRSFPELSFTIDYESLMINVLLPLVCKAETCLVEIEKVLPGECLSVGDQVTRQFLWNPITVSQDYLQIDTVEAADLIRDKLHNVVEALARPYCRVLHNLGGLDSSILLSCLTAARNAPEITCVNFYTAAFGGDERRYTRKMAAHAGVPLVERRLDPGRVDLNIWRTQEMGPSPPAMFDSLTLASDIHGLAQDLAVDVLSYGSGGDSVLFQAPYIFSALDYVALKAPARRWGRTAMEAAQYGGRSLAYTAREMVREKLRPPPCFDTIIKQIDPETQRYYLKPDLPSDWASPKHLHPMLNPSNKFPKGKYYHILSSSFFDVEGHRYRFPPHREFDYICPLVAQPFVELCLQIPTWQLVDGGVNRGLARRAFWKDLPREIIGRTSKSTSEGVYEQLFARNLPALRETLLDGRLAREGFFNRERLEMALSPRRDQLIATDPALLFDLYAWETWTSRWSN
jgi:asparagine synthase (glutamine-hydrolysing)